MRIAVVAALLSLSTAAQAANWPKTITGEYCWQGAGCSPISFTLEKNGEFNTSDGYHGLWTYNGQTSQLQMEFDTGTVYNGTRNGQCFQGNKQSYAGLAGTWWACI